MASMALADYRRALGLSPSQLAQKVQEMSGLHITKQLILDIETYRDAERPAVALPKVQAIVQFLSREMGRPIRVADIRGLQIC